MIEVYSGLIMFVVFLDLIALKSGLASIRLLRKCLSPGMKALGRLLW